MRIVMVVKRASEVTGEAEDWKREFEQRTGRTVEVVDPETKEGEGFCAARGIVQYPAITVEEENSGKVSFLQQGKPLPLFDDILAYL